MIGFTASLAVLMIIGAAGGFTDYFSRSPVADGVSPGATPRDGRHN